MTLEAKERALALQAETNKTILPQVADPKADLKAERAKGNFNVHKVSAILYGGEAWLKRRTELIRMLAEDPAFSKEDLYYWNNTEYVDNITRMNLELVRLHDEKKVDKPNEVAFQRASLGAGAIDLNFAMFLPTVNGQGTDEQRNHWLPQIFPNGPVIGTYAQTELGHGTFLRGLETTATYDRVSQEFVVHTPTITASKWWPGGLGKTANHVVLMARLFIDGKDYGPHAFMVQLRDVKTYDLLAGIETGDIGPKMGFNGVNNGFLRFDHVRIPLSHMLSRHSGVTPDGKYVRAKGSSEKSSYGTMILIRANIVGAAASNLAKALTVSIRYSAVRRQTKGTGQYETQVIDYTTQQHQLFTLLSTAYALQFTGQYMLKLYADFMKAQQTGNSKEAGAALPEVHATSAGLKALVTELAANGIEVARKCCGGHGFSQFSGLPRLYEEYVAACTYEGENTVMSLQTARFLHKSVEDSLQGNPLVGNARYLEGAAKRIDNEVFGGHTKADLSSPAVQLAAFQHRAARILLRVHENHAAQIKAGVAPDVAWNNNLVDLVRGSKAHCYVLLISNFIAAVNHLPNGPEKTVLSQLRDLFALSVITDQLGDFTEDGYMTRQQARLVRETSISILPLIRPNAVSLVDAWAFHDYELNSALGRADGDVYNALYAWAKKSPLNKVNTPPGFDKTLQPFLSKL